VLRHCSRVLGRDYLPRLGRSEARREEFDRFLLSPADSFRRPASLRCISILARCHPEWAGSLVRAESFARAPARIPNAVYGAPSPRNRHPCRVGHPAFELHKFGAAVPNIPGVDGLSSAWRPALIFGADGLDSRAPTFASASQNSPSPPGRTRHFFRRVGRL